MAASITDLTTSAGQAPAVVDVVRGFLDVATAAGGRATFYNTTAEQLAVEASAHTGMLKLDRGVYAAVLAGPGVTDRARQVGARLLLDRPWTAAAATLFDEPAETMLLGRMAAALPVPRRLKLFGDLASGRVNNARARKLILRQILGEERLEWWCVRYRTKLETALAHAWGQRTVGILRGVLGKPTATRTAVETALLARLVDRWAPGRDPATVHECVGFALGVEDGLRLPLLVAYHQAKANLPAGARLPYETLEGIRSTFHRGSSWTSADVLELTAGQLTGSQRLQLDRRAAELGVDVALDLGDAGYDATRLYLYALARGLTAEVAEALQARAARTGARLPLGARHVGLVLDGSASMAGGATQPLRPLAVMLALRDAVAAACEQVTEIWCGGHPDDGGLVRPAGATALAGGLLAALAAAPDLIVLVTDGYENAPAGRTAEVLAAARRLGIGTPVVQLSPVVAAEASGVRGVAEQVPVLPVHRPEALELAWVRLLLDVDPVAAARALVRLARLATPGLLEVPA